MKYRAGFRAKLSVAAWLMAAFSLTDPTMARQDDAPAIAPEARALLDAVADAYQKMPTYLDSGRLTRTLRAGASKIEDASVVKLAFERPNKCALAYDGVSIWSDGKDLHTAIDALRKYRKQPAPATLRLPDIMNNPIGSMLGGTPAEPPIVAVLTLLLSDRAVDTLLEGAASLQIEGADADPTRVLILKRPPKPELRLTIDTASKRITRIDARFDPDALKATSATSASLDEFVASWDLSGANRAAPDAQDFAFKAPAGFSAVVVAEAKKPVDEGHRLLGQAAPDFKFQVLESGGKTRAVSKADLAGKVVVIDFWATWCPPCREELPEIQRLSERLAKTHARDVVVIALSQDRAPEDDSPVRALVEKSLEELKVSFANAVAKVGIDPGQEVGDAFGVEGLPTVVVLDREGVVQSVHVGYREGVGDELAEEVESLLAGKPLVKPADGAKEPGAPK